MNIFNIHTYIFEMIKEMAVLKKPTSTSESITQLNHQSLRNSDSVYIGSNPVSPAIKSSTYALRQNRATSTNIHILMFLLFIVTGCASIQGNIKTWNKVDTARQVAVTGTLLTDWSMTDDTAQRPESRVEINPILGEHPSRGKVAGYFVGCTFAHGIISAVLPQKINDDKGDPVKFFGIPLNPRAVWQYVTIIGEGIAIGYSF